MNIIDRKNLEQWSDRSATQGQLSELMKRLVLTSVSVCTDLNDQDLPGENEINRPGYDGYVDSYIEHKMFPKGKSVWEYSINKGTEKKANDDYEKYEKDKSKCPEIKNISDDRKNHTFIFVTSRIWNKKKKEEWVTEKKEKGEWKDVRAYDASDLEKWLLQNPSVTCWLLEKMGVINDQVMTVDKFVNTWLSPIRHAISSEVVVEGRKMHKKQFKDWLYSNDSELTIRSITVEEAIVFIHEVMKCLPSNQKDEILSKTIVARNKRDMDNLITFTNHQLYIIPNFPEIGSIQCNIDKVRYIIPLDPTNTTSKKPCIELPRLDKHRLKRHLVNMKEQEDRAKKYADNSGGSLAVLKRIIRGVDEQPNWTENYSSVIPILFTQNWERDRTGDNAVIEQLSRKSPNDYERDLNRLLVQKDSPIHIIGNQWKIASPLDAWIILLPYIARPDLKNFKKVSIQVLKAIDPYYCLSSLEDNISNIQKIQAYCTNDMRKGIAYSLVIFALFCDRCKGLNSQNSQEFIDEIVTEVLDNESIEQWLSLGDVLPLLAEASPESFLDALENLSMNDDGLISLMYSESKTYGMYVELLWALERLAWDNEYAERSCILLAKFAEHDDGGNVANRPINSLINIFFSRNPQTTANDQARNVILKQIIEKYPNTGWRILIELLTRLYKGGSFTHNSRYQYRELKFPNDQTTFSFNKLIADTDFIVNNLLILAKGVPNRWGKIIIIMNRLPSNVKDIIIKGLEDDLDSLISNPHSLKETLHSIIYTYKKLPEGERDRLRKIYEQIVPEYDIMKYKQMFDDEYPEMYDASGNTLLELDQINEQRKKTVSHILSKKGFDWLMQFAKDVEMPHLLAVSIDPETIENNYEAIIDNLTSDNKKIVLFCQNTVYKSAIHKGNDWTVQELKKAISRNLPHAKLLNLCLSLPVNVTIWEMIDSQLKDSRNQYWAKVRVNVMQIEVNELRYCLNRYMAVERFDDVLNGISWRREGLYTNFIVDKLNNIHDEGLNKLKSPMSGYHISKIIKTVQKDDRIKEDDKAEIEWKYLLFLITPDSRTDPEYLFKKLFSNPGYFLSMIKLIYRPEVSKAQTHNTQNQEQRKIMLQKAEKAWQLLENWKSVPGLKDNGEIEYDTLDNWVSSLISSAEIEGYSKICKSYIGKILARTPMNIEFWPQDSVCKVIEKYYDKTLHTGFLCEVPSLGGCTVRGIFEGGIQERDIAERYRKLAEQLMHTYPKTKKILKDIATEYEKDAKREDEHAEKNKWGFS